MAVSPRLGEAFQRQPPRPEVGLRHVPGLILLLLSLVLFVLPKDKQAALLSEQYTSLFQIVLGCVWVFNDAMGNYKDC